jgi:PAS domain S-box-containing protein
VSPKKYVNVRGSCARATRGWSGARELDESRAALESLLMAAPLGIGLFDRDMRFRMVNPRLAQIHGVPPEDHVGRTATDVVPLAPAALLVEVHREVLGSGKPRAVEIVAETAATPGRTRTFSVQWYPVKSSAGIIGAGVIVEDVTQRRAAEAFRENILGVVGHDLRSPVQAISTSAELILRRHEFPDDVRRLTRPIVRSASRMAAMIDQLFDYVLLDRGGTMPLQRRKVEFADIAKKVVEETRLALHDCDRDVRVTARGDTSGDWDDTRVTQALTNLVRNAIQHGKGHVDIRLAGGDDLASIEVENAGTPIPPAALGHLFEPFQSGSRAPGHLGLGLYITRQLVLAHGGTIHVRSDAQRTIFTVVLPKRAPSSRGDGPWATAGGARDEGRDR